MTCAKRTVTCRIESLHPSGELEYVEATNWCANPQPSCPRAPGEDYAKCSSICQQSGHAETNALKLAREAHIHVRGGTAILRGHYWMCAPCGAALFEAGIKTVVVELAAP